MSAKAKPKKAEAVEVTTAEGGLWYPFKKHDMVNNPRQVHSIKFADGTVWDAINGWRHQ